MNLLMTQLNYKEKNKVSLQYKILLGYMILVAVIGSMVAIILYEREQMRGIEAETLEIWELRQSINTVHRHLAVLASWGESVVVWEESDYRKYRERRLRTDSLLQVLQQYEEDFVPTHKIDTLRSILVNKEKHLYHTMQTFRQHDSMLLDSLSVITRQAETFRTITRKKKGIAGLFGGKETVQVPNIEKSLNSLNRQIVSVEKERQQAINDHMDILQVQNQQLNMRLYHLIQKLNELSQSILQKKEQYIKEAFDRSTKTVTGLIICAVILFALSYWIILRDIGKKMRTKRERERLIAELNQSVRQNEALITSRKKAVHTITHELRTPLATINGYAELMRKERNEDKTGQYIQNILQSSNRMRDMLNTLLDFFRLDNGKEQPRLSPCRISAIAHTLEMEFMPTAMNKGIFLKVTNGNDAIVLTDKERIIQIGNNLLSNAIKFTEEGGVSLITDCTNGMLTITVEDTGTGMTEEEQQRSFNAFERFSNAAAKDGFGLGLAIVYNIVVMLGGEIRLKSEKGKGSRFTVEIPVQEAEEVPKQTIQTYICQKDRNLNVVAIDNDEVLLQMLKEMYAQEGIHCDTCTNVTELIELIRRKAYGLLLTDLNMPDINGFELLELLRSSNVGNAKTIPVVVATASGSCEREELLAHGFAGRLFKPFSISELMEVSNRCAMKAISCGKPDFSTLLSYGNEAVMLEKLIAETEKEMQAVRDAATQKDLPELDALTHHLRSSWEILRADQPLRGLYGLLHSGTMPDDNALNHAVTLVLDMGTEIIRLAKEERRKFKNG